MPVSFDVVTKIIDVVTNSTHMLCLRGESCYCYSLYQTSFLYLYCSLAQVGLLGMAMGPYVDSTWGVAQFSVPNETPCMCAFVGDKKTVVGKYECI